MRSPWGVRHKHTPCLHRMLHCCFPDFSPIQRDVICRCGACRWVDRGWQPFSLCCQACPCRSCFKENMLQVKALSWLRSLTANKQTQSLSFQIVWERMNLPKRANGHEKAKCRHWREAWPSHHCPKSLGLVTRVPWQRFRLKVYGCSSAAWTECMLALCSVMSAGSGKLFVSPPGWTQGCLCSSFTT